MLSTTDDIYEMKDRPAPAPATSTPPPSVAPRPTAKRPWLTRASNIFIWILAALFIGALVYRMGKYGLDLREQLWKTTRTIRFDYDVRQGFRYGSSAMREGERMAGLPPYADAQKPTPRNPKIRRLTAGEIVQGIVHFYDRMYDENPDGDYGLDYPPLRLTAMTLWARYAQHENPRYMDFPRRAEPGDTIEGQTKQTLLRQTQDTQNGQTEDFALPILKFNTLCEAVAAIGMFLLVWLWVQRGSNTTSPSPGTPGEGRGGGDSRGGRSPHGLLVFFIATAGFWYALTVLAFPPPRPAPIVDLTRIDSTGTTAIIRAAVDPQGVKTSWQIAWGSSSYGRFTPLRDIPEAERDAPVSATLVRLKPGQTIHFRLVASSDNGTTATDDQTFIAGRTKATLESHPVGGAAWPSYTVWLRLLILFIAMVISARLLSSPHRGWACGLIAGLLVWLNPIILLDGHVWPQWDVWILPFFVLAVLCASLDAWICAGIFLGVGCLFKGQLLLAAPVLLMWPLFSGRFAAALRLVAGSALAAGIFLSPWLLASADARSWFKCVLIAAAIALAASLFRRKLWPRKTPPPVLADNLDNVPVGAPAVLHYSSESFRQRSFRRLFNHNSSPAWLITGIAAALLSFVAVAILIYKGLPAHSDVSKYFIAALLLMIVSPPWIQRRKSTGVWLACIGATAIWLAGSLFNASISWYKVGFEYGSQKQDRMQMGLGSFGNFPAILTERFNWDLHSIAATFHFNIHRFGLNIDFTKDLEVKKVLLILYSLCLVICGIAAAVHSRRKDPRILVALIAPWIIFPIVLGQMSERYVLWGSALSAVCISVSTGLTLLSVMLAIVGAGMMAHQLLSSDPSRWQSMSTFFTPLFPGAGWMMLLLAAIFLASALLPSPRRMPLLQDLQ